MSNGYNQPTGLNIHFLDGNPTGMLTVGVPNWDGQVLLLKGNKENLEAFRERPEADYAGTYILLGNLLENEENKQVAYIGKADNLNNRIRTSLKEQEQKKFEFECESIVLVTKVANRLNTAEALYTEARLIKQAEKVQHVPLTNGEAGSKPKLSEMQIDAMDQFLNTLFLILPAIGIDVFNDKTRKSAEKPGEEADKHEFQIKNMGATLDISGGEYMVKSGSLAGKWKKNKSPDSGYARQQKLLVDQGILVPDEQDDRYKFKKNYVFDSLSAASSVVCGRPSSGPAEWRHVKTKKSYKEWREATQLA